LFVDGIQKARIVYDEGKGFISARYHTEIENPEDYKRFAKLFNEMAKDIREGQEARPPQ
jgi:hypothetical protein